MQIWQRMTAGTTAVLGRMVSLFLPRPTPARRIDHHLDDMAMTISTCHSRQAELEREEEKVMACIRQNQTELAAHLRAARGCAARGQMEAARTHLKAKEKSERVSLELRLRHEDFHKQRESLVDAERDLVLYMDNIRSKKALLIGQEETANVRLMIAGEDGGHGTGVQALLEEMETEVLHRHVRALLS